jgi:hypothetical protein
MDTPTATLIAVAIFALLVIFLALRFKGKLKAGIKGPAGTSLDVDASNPEPTTTPGVRMDGVKSRAGGVQAIDGTGRGADVRNVDAYGDVRATSDPSPKAGPPA